MPTIDVFLMFDPKVGRNYWQETDPKTKKPTKKRDPDPIPDWKALETRATQKGYTLVVHGPPSNPLAQDIQDSMTKADVTLFVGHGSNPTPAAGKFVTDQIVISDGTIKAPDGLIVGKWTKRDQLDNKVGRGKLKINKVTGVFTCNSTDKLPNAFDIPSGSHLITNDGGKDGLTRVGTLEWGAFAFVQSYIENKGQAQQVEQSMKNAQDMIEKKAYGKGFPSGDKRDHSFLSDQDDNLHDKVGVTPPPPPKRHPRAGPDND
jgi:hypothetical protein